MRPAGRATPWDRAKPGRELQPPTSPGTPRPPQGGWWVSGGEAGGSGARVRLGLPSWGAPSWQWACGFSQGLVAGVMGWLQARHPSLAEAAPGLRLLLPAVWDESCRGGESPASPHPPPPRPWSPWWLGSIGCASSPIPPHNSGAMAAQCSAREEQHGGRPRAWGGTDSTGDLKGSPRVTPVLRVSLPKPDAG